MSQDPVDVPVKNARADSRGRVLQTIQASPSGCDVQFIAEHTGLHANTVRFHLERLEADDLVRRQVGHGSGSGRPPLLYTAAAVPNAGNEHREFGQLAKVLAQLVATTNRDPVGPSIDAGRAWGLELAAVSPAAPSQEEAVSALVEILNQIGFAPEVSHEGEDTVLLQRHCPFLEAAQTHQDVVCSIHLGLMRGLLEGMDAPAAVESLIPFAGPNGCRAPLVPFTKTDPRNLS